MTTSRTTSRLIIVLLFLAGLLLLRKPVFGQNFTTKPAHAAIIVPGVQVRKAANAFVLSVR